jgi:hypothetical protein
MTGASGPNKGCNDISGKAGEGFWALHDACRLFRISIEVQSIIRVEKQQPLESRHLYACALSGAHSITLFKTKGVDFGVGGSTFLQTQWRFISGPVIHDDDLVPGSALSLDACDTDVN